VNYRSIISRLNSEIDLHLFVFLFSLAVANTDLIRYFLAFEPKLRSLLHTIRLWIKQKDLLGKGHRFNTYTLFWMIVCTLQLHDKQLPSVQSLAEHASKSNSFYSIEVYVFL
jgi:DNA polymerase sigma